MFETLARFYGWTPADVGKMTYRQITVYLAARVKNDERINEELPEKPQTIRATSWQDAKQKLAEINAAKATATETESV